MSVLYIVTDCDYSDYHIVGVFSTWQKADDFCSTWDPDGYGTPRIEQYDLDPIEVERGTFCYFGRINPSTLLVHDVHRHTPSYTMDHDEFTPDVKGNYYTIVFSKDKDHAVKAIADKFRAWKAR